MKPQKRTRILGAYVERKHNNETGREERFMNKPAPANEAMHFRSAAHKRRHFEWQKNGIPAGASITDNFYKVPVYDGADNKTLRKVFGNVKYNRKVKARKAAIAAATKVIAENLDDVAAQQGLDKVL